MKKKAKNLSNEPTNPQPSTTAKSSNGKPFVRCPYEEFNRALRDRNLPEEQLLVIFSHASPEPKSKTKKQKKQNKPQSIPPLKYLPHLPIGIPNLPLLITSRHSKKIKLSLQKTPIPQHYPYWKKIKDKK